MDKPLLWFTQIFGVFILGLISLGCWAISGEDSFESNRLQWLLVFPAVLSVALMVFGWYQWLFWTDKDEE